MALTPARWIATALIGFLLTSITIIGDAESRDWRPSQRDRLTQRLYVAEARAGQAADELRLIQLRDSIVRIANSSMRPFATDRAFDRHDRALIDSLIAGARLERAIAGRVPTAVFVLLDTVTLVRGQRRRTPARGVLAIDYILPTESSARCIVIARVRTVTTRRLYEAELRSNISRDRLLGPCAYFEHFGFPGKPIRRWLDDRGWQFAQRASFTTAPPRWLDGVPDSSYRDRIDLQWVMAPSGRACAGGQTGSCLEALLSRPSVDDRHRQLTFSAGVVTPGFHNPFVHGDNSWLTGSWPLGAREWTLLADMVRSVGPERFERFWSSELSPDLAFQSATGRSMPEWTREWIETTYHPQAIGPALAAGATGVAALLMVLAIALSIVAARRRQIG